MPDVSEEPAAWEIQPGETARAYRAFRAFRDAGLGRSLAATYRQETGRKQAGQPSGEWNAWAERHRWRERAAAHDAHQDALARKAAEAQHAARLTAYRERAAKIGAATADVGLGFLVKAGQRLKTLDVESIPITSLPAFLRAAAAVTQISLNVEAESLGVHALEDLMSSNEDEGAAEG